MVFLAVTLLYLRSIRFVYCCTYGHTVCVHTVCVHTVCVLLYIRSNTLCTYGQTVCVHTVVYCCTYGHTVCVYTDIQFVYIRLCIAVRKVIRLAGILLYIRSIRFVYTVLADPETRLWGHGEEQVSLDCKERGRNRKARSTKRHVSSLSCTTTCCCSDVRAYIHTIYTYTLHIHTIHTIHTYYIYGAW
jgi:hypothetical protein